MEAAAGAKKAPKLTVLEFCPKEVQKTAFGKQRATEQGFPSIFKAPALTYICTHKHVYAYIPTKISEYKFNTKI